MSVKTRKRLENGRILRNVMVLAALLFGLGAPLSGAQADDACVYDRLLVLAPGEELALETPTGKTGTPLVQRIGEPFDVRVLATVGNWVVRNDVTHVIRLTSTDDTAVLPDAEPMYEGALTVQVTFNQAGSFRITAEDLTDHEHYQAVSSVIQVIDPTSLPQRLAISPLGDPQQVGTPATVTVEALDGEGDRATSVSGAVQLQQVFGNEAGWISPAWIEMSNGVWTGEIGFMKAGADAQVMASLAADPRLLGVSNVFDIVPGPADRLLVLLPGQMIAPATAGGYVGSPTPQYQNLDFAARIYATDTYWNPTDASAAVTLTSGDGAANMPLGGTLTGGMIELRPRFGTAGVWTLTASAADGSGLEPMTTLPIAVLANQPTFVVDPVPETVTAGVSFTVRIEAVHGDGSAMTEYDAPARLACEVGPGSIQPEVIQFEDGVWLGQVTLFGAASSTSFSCADYASPPNVGTSAPLRVVPNVCTGVQVVLPGESLTGGLVPPRSGTPDEQWAGQELTLRIVATDAWSNLVPDVDREIALTTTDPYADLPDTVQVNDGWCDVAATFYRAGTHHITTHDATWTDPEAGIVASSRFKVHPGDYARMILLAPGEELLSGSSEGKIGDALDQSITYAFDLTLLATDRWFNPRDDIGDRIAWSVTDALAELPGESSLARGELVVPARLSTGGFQLITATNLDREDIPAATAQVRAINSGFHIEAHLDPEYVIAGQPFTLSVSVTNDAGAVMQEVNSRVNVRAVNAVTGEPGTGRLLNSTFQLLQGRRTVSQNYTGAEPIVLEVTGDVDQAPGVTNLIEVVPAAASRLDFENPPAWVGGRKTTTLTAMVTDEFGNGIDNIPVAFTLTAGQGQLDPLDRVTNLVGRAQARYTGYSEPEKGAVMAEAAGFEAELEIETSLVDPDRPAGSITNSPNPFHPDEGDTEIRYKLARDADVTLKMYTLSGSLVLEDKYYAGEPGGTEGENLVLWDGRNGQGETVASGGYILQVEAERDGESIHKMRRRIGVVR